MTDRTIVGTWIVENTCLLFKMLRAGFLYENSFLFNFLGNYEKMSQIEYHAKEKVFRIVLECKI